MKTPSGMCSGFQDRPRGFHPGAEEGGEWTGAVPPYFFASAFTRVCTRVMNFAKGAPFIDMSVVRV